MHREDEDVLFICIRMILYVECVPCMTMYYYYSALES